MQVRQAVLADLPIVAPLFDAYRIFYGQASDHELATRFLADKLEHQRSTIFLGLIGDEAVGFAQLYPTFSSVQARPALILNDLFVAPAARGRGVAKALLAAAADYGRSRGAAWLTLSTAVDNAAAQALYEREAWVREARFVSYGLSLG